MFNSYIDLKSIFILIITVITIIYFLSLINLSTQLFKKFFNSLKSLNYKAYMSTTNKNLNLDPNFVTGFTDAEGSFMVSILKDSEMRIGWSVGARFEITLHLRDEDILNKIQTYFEGVGKIYKFGEDKISYRVNNLEQIITIIIPHFKKYPLNTNKRGDF